jgi:hypothetical protein
VKRKKSFDVRMDWRSVKQGGNGRQEGRVKLRRDVMREGSVNQTVREGQLEGGSGSYVAGSPD